MVYGSSQAHVKARSEYGDASSHRVIATIEQPPAYQAPTAVVGTA
jgi:hypothetical protein